MLPDCLFKQLEIAAFSFFFGWGGAKNLCTAVHHKAIKIPMGMKPGNRGKHQVLLMDANQQLDWHFFGRQFWVNPRVCVNPGEQGFFNFSDFLNSGPLIPRMMLKKIFLARVFLPMIS